MRITEQGGDVVLPPGEVVVNAEHVFSLAAQPLAQMRAEKSGAAGDEYALHDSTHYDRVP